MTVATFLKQNEGTVDRVLRVALGLAILSLAFIGPKTPWAYFGIIPIVTGAMGVCPVYSLLGINTCPVQRR